MSYANGDTYEGEVSEPWIGVAVAGYGADSSPVHAPWLRCLHLQCWQCWQWPV